MGILQGIAEFLPISSSGHLALFQHFFAMENVEESQMFFTVLLHFATLIAVCVYYWQDIIDMIREFFLGIRDLASRGRPFWWAAPRRWAPCPASPGPASPSRRGCCGAMTAPLPSGSPS